MHPLGHLHCVLQCQPTYSGAAPQAVQADHRTRETTAQKLYAGGSCARYAVRFMSSRNSPHLCTRPAHGDVTDTSLMHQLPSDGTNSAGPTLHNGPGRPVAGSPPGLPALHQLPVGLLCEPSVWAFCVGLLWGLPLLPGQPAATPHCPCSIDLAGRYWYLWLPAPVVS